jgi:hypothetical protein
MAAAAALAVIVVTCAVSDTAQTPRLTAVVASDTQRTTRKAVVRTSLKRRTMMTFRASLEPADTIKESAQAFLALELWRQLGKQALCRASQGRISCSHRPVCP